MERITKQNYKFDMLNIMQGLNRCTEIDEIMNRLAAYEDTGLMPDEIPHWIPVSERLPEIQEEPSSEFTSDVGKGVLVCDADGYVYEATYWKISRKFQDNGIDCEPAYWMPLPQPPKEEKP